MRGYVALSGIVQLDGHILKCSKGKGTRTAGLECKNPPKSESNLAEEQISGGHKAGAGL
jgi:hypothetical protein